jgi:hypothetical protein
MTAWQKLGERGDRIYRRILDSKEMYGVKRIDVTYMEGGTIIITVETEKGVIAVNLHRDDR